MRSHLSKAFFLPAVLLLLTGCYDRWTGNYDTVPEATDLDSAELETSELSPDELKERERLL